MAQDFPVIAETIIVEGRDDTNSIKRSSVEEAAELRKWIQAMLDSPEGVKESQVLELDQELIRKNISAGGCADLLALTDFLYELAYLL